MNHTLSVINDLKILTMGFAIDGNELMMGDLADCEKINLHTKDKKNILTLDANNEGHKLALRTENGKAEFYAKKIMHIGSDDR